MTSESIIDPAREIVDPHHHLWERADIGNYLLDELHADTGSGHNVVQTVYMECGSGYRTDGSAHLRPVGESAFVAEIAVRSAVADGATIAAIVAHADLALPLEQLDEVLDAHVEASGGLFRGIRDALSSAPAGVPLMIPGGAAPDKAADPAFRRGVAHLGGRGFTYDTWQYHLQNQDFLALARAVPETTMVLDHLGTPLGVGEFTGKHDEIFPTWAADMRAIAACPNVVVKLGGMAMPDNGFGWHLDPANRPTSDTFVAAQERWYHHMIEAFGPERCMFESNFPVDKWSIDYDVLFNGLKKIAARYSDAEQDAMFAGTARRVYGL